MEILRQLSFSGRFKVIKIGIIVDFAKFTPCIQAIVNELLKYNIDFMILDTQKIYRVEDGYFDIIFCDLSVGSVSNYIDKWIFLISAHGLLVEIVSGDKFIRTIPDKLCFQKILTFPLLNPDLKCKYLVYRYNGL